MKRQTQIIQRECANGSGTLCYFQKGQLIQGYLQLNLVYPCVHKGSGNKMPYFVPNSKCICVSPAVFLLFPKISYRPGNQ